MKQIQNPKSKTQNRFDVLIIGGGAAGLSAGLWCADLGLTALLLEAGEEFGGQLLWTHNRIENHLGAQAAANGRELRDVFVRQTADRRFTRRLGAAVATVDVNNKTVRLESGEEFSGRALVIATGVRRRTLSIPGEQEFRGHGIIESGKRDHEEAAGRDVLIIGGGDAALENVLILAKTARRVFLVHRRAEFRGRAEFSEKLPGLSNFEFLPETVPVKISGDARVEAVELENTATGARRILPVEIVLIRIGVEPVTGFLDGKLDLDEHGYICIDSLGATSVPGVFAIGDVANPLAPTVSSAIGMGATAVKAISSWIKQK